MARIILSYLVPLILPMALYMGWIWILRHRSKARGDELPEVNNTGIFWSFVIGVLFMLAGLAFLAVTGGSSPGTGQYQAPRMENGRIASPELN